MLDVDLLIQRCIEARAETEPRLATREVLEWAVADETAAAEALRPEEAGLTVLYRSPELTVLHVVWAPGMSIYPHDHRMWAAIGIYSGQEDNAFFRRTGEARGAIVESGGAQLVERDVLLLGDDAIHSVTNPRDRLTGAIHVYGGDLVDQPRSQWGPGPLEERPSDFESSQRLFAEANAAWRAAT